MSDLSWMNAPALAAAYAKRELSPVEVVDALFDRIEKLDGELNAFILPDREGATAAARAADAEIMAGRSRGKLHGVPLGVKDIIDVAGLPTTCHSKILQGNVAKADSAVVAKLRGAGMIPMGKLSTHRFAFSPQGRGALGIQGVGAHASVLTRIIVQSGHTKVAGP